jgi:UDP-N-acetylmuramate--alanine ligase
MNEVNNINDFPSPPLGAEGLPSPPSGAEGLTSGSPLRGAGGLYFIGIGGIGMSALARYYHSKGITVSGYDRTLTPLTQELEAEGINIHYEDNVELIPRNADLIVYTPAVPATHKELQFYQTNGYTVVKRSDVLGTITKSSFNICVAGTHGKTTTSTMIAHILRDTGYGCNAFLGGISANYGTNFWANERNVCVVEADEYDRSFLKLYPDVAVITAMDPDHLDIYGTAQEFEDAFVEFTGKIKSGGCLISKFGLNRSNDFKAGKHFTYSYNNTGADAYASKVRVENEAYIFDVVSKDWMLTNLQLQMGGLHNIENCVAAISVAKLLGIDDEKIKSAVHKFKGVKRRFEYVLKDDRHVLIDDYAHHPEELRALINGVKSLFKKRLFIIFQPHLYTRTKDQADGFAEVLDMANEVILLPIYPARELPIEGVSSEMIAEKMAIKDKHVLSKEDMKQWIKKLQPQLLVMAGAGDIDALVEPVKEILLEQ